MAHILDEEYIAYRESQARLRQQFRPDEIVLFHGRTCAGVYPSRAAAYRAGLGLFGNVPMLIRTVGDADDRPVFITRLLGV